MMPVKRKNDHIFSSKHTVSQNSIGLFLLMGAISTVVLSVFFINENQDLRKRALESYNCSSNAECGPLQLCQKDNGSQVGRCIDERLFPTIIIPTVTPYIAPESLRVALPTSTPVPEKIVVIPRSTDVPQIKQPIDNLVIVINPSSTPKKEQTTNLIVTQEATPLPKSQTSQVVSSSDLETQPILPPKTPPTVFTQDTEQVVKEKAEIIAQFSPSTEIGTIGKTSSSIAQSILSLVEPQKTQELASISNAIQTVAVSAIKPSETINSQDVTKTVANIVATNIAYVQQESGKSDTEKSRISFITDTEKGIEYHSVTVPVSGGKVNQSELSTNIDTALEFEGLSIHPKVIEVVHETKNTGKPATILTAESIKYTGGNVITCSLKIADCPLASISNEDLNNQLAAVQSTTFTISVNSPKGEAQKADIGSVQNVSILTDARGDLLIEQKAGKNVSASLASAFLFAPISEQLPAALRADTVQVSEPVKPVMNAQQQLVVDNQLLSALQYTGQPVVKETKDALLIQTIAEQLGFRSALVQTESGKGFLPITSGAISPQKLNEMTEELLNAKEGKPTLADQVDTYSKANPVVQFVSATAYPGIDKLSALATDSLEVVTVKMQDLNQQTTTYDLKAQSSTGAGSPVKMILISDAQGNVAISLKAEEFASEELKAKVDFFNQQLNTEAVGFENLLIQKISN